MKKPGPLLGFLALMGLVLSGCNLAGPAPSTPSPALVPSASGTPYVYYVRDDLQFIDMMVPHHQLAIDMARVAEQHAQHGQIIGLARDIIAAQNDEITRMLIWRGEL